MDDILASIREAVAIEPRGVDMTDGEGGVGAGADTAGPLQPAADTTIEALVRSALEPLLKAWLDAHLPEIVERLAQAEIARLTARV